MNTTIRTATIPSTLLLALLLSGCTEGHMGPAIGDATLLSVSPPGGAFDVDPNATVRATFSHALMVGMEAYAILHRGDVTGPEVAGAWSLVEGRTVLSFTPDTPLEKGALHTIHLGGGMRDASGHGLDMHTHGPHLGGGWVHREMMGGGYGPGHSGGHMGDGWRHGNGSFGMAFAFTTKP